MLFCFSLFTTSLNLHSPFVYRDFFQLFSFFCRLNLNAKIQLHENSACDLNVTIKCCCLASVLSVFHLPWPVKQRMRRHIWWRSEHKRLLQRAIRISMEAYKGESSKTSFRTKQRLLQINPLNFIFLFNLHLNYWKLLRHFLVFYPSSNHNCAFFIYADIILLTFLCFSFFVVIKLNKNGHIVLWVFITKYFWDDLVMYKFIRLKNKSETFKDDKHHHTLSDFIKVILENVYIDIKCLFNKINHFL